MALQTITAVGDSGTIAAAAIILAADPTDLATTGDSGTISGGGEPDGSRPAATRHSG